MQIHPQALISSSAQLGNDVQIGPFCIIEDDVVIDDGCCLEARVTVKSGTVIGKNNHIFEGTTLGGLPQCVGIGDDCGTVVIGDGNIIRENVSIHRAMKEGDATEIGDNCMLMVNAHVAHDCRLGNEVIMANNSMLAGHVFVGRRAFISGAAGIHQFCRVGAFAMVGGQAHIVRDIPPFVTVDGITSQVVGLNLIGLRRAGFSTEDIKTLKAVYRILYRSNLPWRDIVKKIEEEYKSGLGLEMAQFLSMTTRGIINERHSASEHKEQSSPNEVATNKNSEEPIKYKFHIVGDDNDLMEYASRHRQQSAG
ncbi:MAG: acyl-ACP--UDP-N-acetylglucosamine O-acyltransferase [Planctomycetia bacterium]|nr:acyl-ACP--UDP-N-acetylglucosamine O-acyltransferase [Planctomycetia bacterium]